MSDALKEAQELYSESLDCWRDQREQIREDALFSDPSNPQQWDEQVKLQREGDPGGARPCLVHDQCGQYVSNVAGQVEQRPPAIHAIPVSGGADKKAAEQIDGRFRHIEHASRATQHYAKALTSAARVGVGYLVVRPEYVDRSLGWQEPRISSEPDALKVILDPWSTDTDGADLQWGYIMTTLAVREFERRWPGKDARDFGDLGTHARSDERKSVLIAEQWYQRQKKRSMVVCAGAGGQEKSFTEDEFLAAYQRGELGSEPNPRPYVDKYTCIEWRRMSGADILEEAEYPASGIGIVPVYGYVGFVDGRMRYCGIPRRARAPQQAYNYHVSEQLAHIGTSPRAPWLVSKRAAAGVEEIWDRAAAESRAWLPFADLDDQGPISSPTRINNATNLVNHEAGAAQALRDIQASIGMYQANLGAQSNETSGVAIESRKQQGEASTAHFPSHMAASLGQVGKLVMEMDSRLADTMRKQPIIGIDEAPGSVTVDPEQESAFERTEDGVSINPAVGKYSVRVVVGASYSTQRTQTNAAFAEIMRGNPELAQTVAPFWAQTLDFPGSDKFAQAMAAMSPPPVKAILQPEDQQQGPDPATMAKQLQEMKQALDEAIKHARDALDEAGAATAAADEAKRLAEVRERELDIKAYLAETDRLKITGANEAQIQAIVSGMVQSMIAQPSPLPPEGAEEEQQQGDPMQQPMGMETMPEQAEPQVEPQEPMGMPEPQQPEPGMGEFGAQL